MGERHAIIGDYSERVFVTRIGEGVGDFFGEFLEIRFGHDVISQAMTLIKGGLSSFPLGGN